MFRLIARILGPIMMADAVFDFAFPEFDADFFASGPGRNWNSPLREAFKDLGCLSPATRRYLAAMEGFVGGLLFALANEEGAARMAPSGRRHEAAPLFPPPAPSAAPGARGPVRIPIEHIRH